MSVKRSALLHESRADAITASFVFVTFSEPRVNLLRNQLGFGPSYVKHIGTFPKHALLISLINPTSEGSTLCCGRHLSPPTFR